MNNKTNNFKIDIGTNIKDDKRDIIITQREYRPKKYKTWTINWKYYKYTCNKCGWTEGWILESDLLTQKNGCSCCSKSPKKFVEGINDIPTTNPWMIKFFQGGYDEAKLYTKTSNKKVYPICPDCGKIKDKPIVISNIYYRKSINCICKDGISYPEKLMISILTQLNINFEFQYTPKWIKPKKYDFYFELKNKKYIIEMDGGLGHGKRVYKNSKKTIEETSDIDKFKDDKAKEHGIEVIRIESQVSSLEFIRDKIIHSKLKNVFSLNIINWYKSEEYALSNLVKIACEYKNNNPNMTTLDIGKLMGLHRKTITDYLKKGNLLNWCDYNTLKESFKGRSKSGKMNGRLCICLNNKKIFKSIAEAQRYYNIGNISAVCRGNGNSAGKDPMTGEKLIWMFYDEYIK